MTAAWSCRNSSRRKRPDLSAKNVATSQGTTRRRALVIASATFADGGIQRFNRTFLIACHNLGITCDVLSLGDSEASRARWSPPSSASISVFGHDKLRFALEATRKIVAGRYDFIVVGHINLLELVMAATKLRRAARIVFIAHGIEVWTGLTGTKKMAMQGVDLLLCVSRYTQQMIRQQVPTLPQERFCIFPNALSESWRSQPSCNTLERYQALPERFLLSVTRLDRGDRYKGVITTLEALAMTEDQSVHYVVAGSGNDLEFITSVAERLEIGPRVHFVGSVSDAELALLYRRCLAFVLPSGKEGFGIVFLEAMFFGAYVIAACEKGAVDVVQHEETGLLVPYGDVVALKHAIDRVLAGSAFKKQVCANALATVVGEGAFTFRSYVARLAVAFDVRAPETEIEPEVEVAATDPIAALELADKPNETCA
jgi:phosphatidylinositol alpha-1,6-mannosyltransferase